MYQKVLISLFFEYSSRVEHLDEIMYSYVDAFEFSRNYMYVGMLFKELWISLLQNIPSKIANDSLV